MKSIPHTFYIICPKILWDGMRIGVDILQLEHDAIVKSMNTLPDFSKGPLSGYEWWMWNSIAGEAIQTPEWWRSPSRFVVRSTPNYSAMTN